MDEVSEFLRVIDAERQRAGESERAFSMRVAGSPDMIRKARDNRALPRPQRLTLIADRLNLTVDQLLGRATVEQLPYTIEAVPANMGDVSRRFRHFPKSLPIYGTAFGHNMAFDGDGVADIEVTIFEPTDVVGYALRPPALEDDQEAYGFRIQGDSMFPAHRPGNFRIALTRQPPRIEDDVIVQLRREIDDGQDGEEVISVLIKTLVRRTADYVELRQYNPLRTFRVPRHMIKAMHLVVDPGDLLDR